MLLLGPPRGQPRQHFGQGADVGVFLMHVEKIDRMRRLMAVEDALFHHHHAVAVRAPVNHTGAHATAGAFTAGQNGIHPQVMQMTQQRCAPEGAGRGFAQNGYVLEMDLQ